MNLSLYQSILILCFSWIFSAFSGFAQQLYPTSIDHIPIAVVDLEGAKIDFQRLGFTIKPGRLHANSINNAHVKFADGRALELITASEPKDQLAADYLKFLKNGDGPAYLALSMDNPEALTKLLTDFNPSLTKGSYYQWITFPAGSPLSYIFFIQYASPPNKEKPYYAHENTVSGIQSIALTKTDFTAEKLLFEKMGYALSPSEANPEEQIFRFKDQYLVLNEVVEAENERPISGISLWVEDMDSLTKILQKTIEFPSSNGPVIKLPEASGHGVEIEFIEAGN